MKRILAKITLFIGLTLWLNPGNSQLHPSLDSIMASYSSKGIHINVSDYHCDDKIGLCHYYLQQTYKELPIYGYIGTFSSTQSQSQSKWHYAPNIAQFKMSSHKSSISQISDVDVVNAVLKEFQMEQIQLKLTKNKARNAERSYTAHTVSQEDITLEEVYVVERGTLKKVIKTAIYLDAIQEWWEVLVDARTGDINSKTSWTLHCSFEETCPSENQEDHHHEYSLLSTPDSSYHVFGLPLNNPEEGDRTIISAPWNEASPLSWHDIDGIPGVDSTNTSGNNVYAYPDRNSDGLPDATGQANGGSSLIFDFGLDLNKQPQDYIEAAITNLFYWNNVIHDIMHNYGFTEAAGNFQNYNYTGQGTGGDYVKAEAQDGSGRNNANFATPPDGYKPRMQMFEWGGNQNISVTINNQKYNATGAVFGPQTTSIQGNIIRTSDTLACNAVDALTGSSVIGMVDRGQCKFVKKALSVQNAGGVAMIVCSNQNALFTMGGDTSATITIPSILLTKSDCEQIKIGLSQGSISGTIDISESKDRDSDLDNGIIIHEYGHGISNRLTGGRFQSSCLNNQEQMGEGWSDYYGLLLTMKSTDSPTDPRGMATYVAFQPISGNGIRTYPYTTDMQINPLTYDNVDEVRVPHGVGTIWATMLWDMTWFLIDKHGFDQNIYEGNNGNHISLRLVTEALKLQPCRPGFVSGRDAILAADQLLYGGENECVIWEAFARRGVGYGADQGDSHVLGDETSSFDVPPACSNILSLKLTSSELLTHVQDTLSLTYLVQNNFSQQIDNLLLIDTIPQPLSIIPGSLNQGVLQDSILTFSQTTSDSGTNDTITVDIEVLPYADIYLEHKESFEGSSSWSFISETGTSGWEIVSDQKVWGNQSVFIKNESSIQTHYMERELYLTESPIFSFWHSYDIEDGWDGGFIQLSDDGGVTWDNLDNNFISHGYDRKLSNYNNPVIGNQLAFTGDSNGFVHSVLDLRDYANQSVILRFVFGSDSAVGQIGWYIDAVALYNAYVLNLEAIVQSDNHPDAPNDSKIIILSECPACEPSYNCPENLLNLSTYTNSYYRANNLLHSNGVLSNGSNLRLRAGNSVELSYPFETDSNAELIIQIEECQD